MEQLWLTEFDGATFDCRCSFRLSSEVNGRRAITLSYNWFTTLCTIGLSMR